MTFYCRGCGQQSDYVGSTRPCTRCCAIDWNYGEPAQRRYVCLQCNQRAVCIVPNGRGEMEGACTFCGLRLQTTGVVKVDDEAKA